MQSDELFWRPQAGQMVGGRYRLNHELFVSGPEVDGYRAATWQATDNALSRSVQMQILGPRDPRVPRFLMAARQTAATDDCRFLRVLDAMEAEGQELLSFVVWEHPEGKKLSDVLSSTRLSNAEAAYVVREVAAALAAPHAAGKFHGRLGLRNILVTLEGDIRVCGFLTDGVIFGDEHEQNWSRREQQDLRDLGVLLYTCLTGCAPVADEASRDGLPAAPRRGAGEKQHWVTPKELRTSTNSGLDKVAMMLLGEAKMRFGTADELATTLTRILASTEPKAELQSKMRAMRFANLPPEMPMASQDDKATEIVSNKAAVTRRDGAFQGSEAPTQEFREVVPDEAPTQIAPAVDVSAYEPQYDDPPTALQPAYVDDVSDVAEPEKSIPISPRQRLVAPAKFAQRRIIALVAILVVLCLVLVMVVRGCSGAGEPAAATEIVNVFSFDPVADGGGEDERSETDQLAHDGDPNTAWTTWTYYGSEKFGNLKTGAGMVLDLGTPQPLGGVHLLLDSSPVDVQLMIPAADPGADQPPMDTVNSWQTVTQASQAGSDIVLRPDQPVTTRWVLVYFTTLPAIAEGQFRTGISEVNLVD
ncbi:hypothetical protein [Propionimicrobium lymphophilum]|uniref:hypothetical protein n=1 Tax=Propionimicrobium lymphophilum TaxID=33012 RepID=UPI0023F39EE7|nr:hypothetical protein [Propionimicrobium lymphophilum]